MKRISTKEQGAVLFYVEQRGVQKPWRVRRGQHWVVMGPNGSGKSLLGAVLAGEAHVRIWRVLWQEELEERVAWVGFAHQCACVSSSWMQARWHASLDDSEMRVSAFLAYDAVYAINPFEVRDADTSARKAFARRQARIVRALDLHALCDKALDQLSNGEMRRVLLGRALLKGPAILVLDDPFAGLDPAMRIRVTTLLTQLAHRDMTLVLMVRHQDEIPAFCTHRLMLDQCRFVRMQKLNNAPALVQAGFSAQVSDAESSRSDQPIVVAMHDVSMRYGRKKVLDHLSWEVRAGERWVITGPNGCGKTTLLSLITGDNPAGYANDVRIFGQSRQEGQSLWHIRRRIGHVSPELQAYADASISCLDCALSSLYSESGTLLNPRAEHRQIARAWLDTFGLSTVARKPLSSLSAGQQRLVFLVRALVSQPDLLILDEVCMNLDESARNLVLRSIERLAQQHPALTILCVAHRKDDIPDGFTRHLALGQGAERNVS